MSGNGKSYQWVWLVAAFGLGALLVGICLTKTGRFNGGACDLTLVRPTLCMPRSAENKQEYDAFAVELEKYIDQQKQSGKVGLVSVYFRDLENGPTFGLNQDIEFLPTDLMYVPTAITILKHAEYQPEILAKKLRTAKDFKYNQAVLPLTTTQLKSDTEYTVWELVQTALLHSDEQANLMLQQYANKTLHDIRPAVIATLVDLGLIPVTTSSTDQDYSLTVKQCASIFRVLYNVSYLSPQLSQKLLETLRQPSYMDGIVAGVPQNVAVAHKAGAVVRDKLLQIHDIGVVYNKDNPYLLAIMTRGDNLENNTKIIAEISKMVWEEVNRRTNK